MKRKTIALLTLGAFTLVILGSLSGIILYQTWFEQPAYYYLAPPTEEPPFATYPSSQVAYPDEGTAPLTGPSFVNASNRARPAVVHIRASFEGRSRRRDRDIFSNPFRDFFDDGPDDSPQGIASGSGVLISPDGYIATNNHVIEDADRIEVTLFDNRRFEAELIGRDVSTDLALIKITAKQLPYLTFGNSEQVEVGQWVLAVGNPMDLTSTVTAGIVSAKGRNINLLRADSRYAIESFIQTDAAVNKGNSGGALVDERGNLIGINTAIASRTGYFSGYSFAIPASIARKVMEDFLTYGEVKRGFLGVQIQAMSAEIADQLGLDQTRGAFVVSVNPDLGAAEAGIRDGDVIISVNEVPINSSSELQEQVSRYRPGDKLSVHVIRDNTEREFIVPLKALDGVGLPVSRKSELEYRGSRFRLLTEAEAEAFGLRQGVKITASGPLLEAGGIEDGLVILEIDGRDVYSIEDLHAALQEAGEYLRITGMYSRGEPKSFSFAW